MTRGRSLRIDGKTIERDVLRDRLQPAADRLLYVLLASKEPRRDLVQRAKVDLPMEVLTLDRIDDRYVWAIGGANAIIWLDKELHRVVRLVVKGPGIDSHDWTANVAYDDHGPGRGWYPSVVVLQRDGMPFLTMSANQLKLSR